MCRCVCCAVDQKVKIVAEAKIPKASDASKHKAGGGNVEIRTLTQHTPASCAAHCHRLLAHSPWWWLLLWCLFSGSQIGLEGRGEDTEGH